MKMAGTTFYPRSNQAFGWILLICLCGLLVFAPLSEIGRHEPGPITRSLLLAWKILVGAGTLFLSIWISRACSDLKPWVRVDQTGIEDRTPLGVGRIAWEEISRACVWTTGSWYFGDRRLGFFLEDPDRAFSRRPFLIRMFLRMERRIGLEPVFRIQGRGLQDGVDPLISEVKKYLPDGRFTEFPISFRRALVLQLIGFGLMFVGGFTLPTGWKVAFISLVSVGFLLVLGGIESMVLFGGRKSKLGALVWPWCFLVLTSWPWVYFLGSALDTWMNWA